MKYESPKALVYLAVAVLVTMLLLAFMVAVCSEAKAQDVPPAPGISFTTFDDFSGGINHTTPRGQLAPNEYLALTNFFIVGNKLQARKGYTRIGSTFSSNPLNFLDVYVTRGGTAYLLMSDGTQLWYSTDITGTPIALDVGRVNRAIVDTWGTYVSSGDSVDVMKWKTVLGTGEGLTMTINGVNYTIARIDTDTSLWLTTSAGTQVDKTYNIDVAALAINSGITLGGTYWLYASIGAFHFGGPSSFVIDDSLTGTRFVDTTGTRGCQFFTALTQRAIGLTGNHSGEFFQNTTHVTSAGGAKNPVTAGHAYFMTYPILGNNTAYVNLAAAAFQPDSTQDHYFTMTPLTYDSTTLFTVSVDSVRLAASDSANFSCNGGEALYLKLYDATFDSSDFITGDWFCVPRYAWGDGEQTYTGTEYVPTASVDVFPVVGGFQATDGAIYAACPPTQFSRNDWSIAGNNKTIAFYRMKRTAPTSLSSNYTWAARYDNRVFWSTGDDPTFVKKSEPHDPATQDGVGFYMFTEEGDAPVAGLVQGDVLKVYCANSIHIITSADGYLYTTQQVARGVGCSAPRTLRESNGTHYFLHHTGVYADEGAVPVPISASVNSWFTDSIPSASYSLANAEVYDNQYWISFPLKSGGWKTLVYDIAAQAWTDLSNLEFSAATTYGSGADSLQFIFCIPDSGSLMGYYGNLDITDSIIAVVQTDYVDQGTIENNKTYRQVQVAWDHGTGASLSLSCYLAHSTTAASTYSFTANSFGSKRINPPSLLGRNISLKLTVNGAAGYKQRLLKVGYEDKNLAN